MFNSDITTLQAIHRIQLYFFCLRKHVTADTTEVDDIEELMTKQGIHVFKLKLLKQVQLDRDVFREIFIPDVFFLITVFSDGKVKVEWTTGGANATQDEPQCAALRDYVFIIH